MLEECVSYLDACVFNMENKKIQDPQEKNYLAEHLKTAKYLCKIHIQLCAILSQLGQHESAFSHGKAAIKECEQFTNDLYSFCMSHLSRFRQKAQRSYKTLIEKPKYFNLHDLASENFPVIEYILNKIRNKKTRTSKTPKLDMRTVLGVQKHDFWIYSYNIGDMMIIHPLSLNDLKNPLGLQAELTNDFLLEKIVMIVIAHFCVATEIRFLTNPTKIQQHEAKILHKKALEIAQNFLPSTCPLYLHIISSYTKHYADKTSDHVKSIDKKYRKKKKADKTPNPKLRHRSTTFKRLRVNKSMSVSKKHLSAF